MRLPALLLLSVVAIAPTARSEQPSSFFVNEIAVDDPRLAGDASALTSALCAALARDKRAEVLCAPDIKQLIAFAATSSMIGGGPSASDKLAEKAAATRWVVGGRLRLDKAGATLTVAVGPKDESSDLSLMFSSTALITIDEKAGGKTLVLLDRMPAVARRLLEASLAPAGGQASGTGTEGAAVAPPAPLSAQPPANASSAAVPPSGAQAGKP
jgi:hypothetical protein